MEREGKGDMRKERREGKEKMRRGIIVGGMVLGLLMGCNNGIAELEKKNQFLSSVVSLGNDFLSIFTSFGDMLGDVLGFNEKTTKSKVGTYFNKIKENVQKTKEQLNAMVENMKAANNPNAEATAAAVKTLIDSKLSKIIEGAETASGAIGELGAELIGNVADQNGGTAGDKVDKLVEGIKGIVEVVLKEGNAEAGDDNKADQLGARTGGKTTAEAGKLFDTDADTDANAKKSAADAAKAVGAVTGSDILQAIKSGGDTVKLADGTVKGAAKRDAVIAGGIALRAMAKGGKFPGPNNKASAEANKTVAGAAISAVTKALDTLTIAIRKTIDEGLKTVKDAMKINANDSPVTSENGVAAK